MVPRDIALLNLVRSLDDDVRSGLYDRPRVVYLASRMSDQDVASMAVHSQQELVIDVAHEELARRGLSPEGETIDEPPAEPSSSETYTLTEEDLEELTF